MKRFYIKHKNGLITCTACRWYCKIPNHFVGLCGIRANINNKLKNLVYGYISSIAIDPIEKKPLFHVLPGSSTLSIGTFGCNFSCRFCQNWLISQTPKLLKEELIKNRQHSKTVETIKKFIIDNSTFMPSDTLVHLAFKYKTPSISFTYNEPTINIEYAIDTMQIAKKQGLLGIFVSSGYESPKAIRALKSYIDAYNIDLKAGSQEFYNQLTGGVKLQGVLDTISLLKQNNKWVEITTLLIPNHNTDEQQIRYIADFIYKLDPYMPWHITAFYPDYKMLDTPPTEPRILLKAYDIAKKVGLHYVYTGNIFDSKTQNTYCHNCGTLLIKRIRYTTEIHDLDTTKGQCKRCGTKIPGIWSLQSLKTI